VEEKASQDLIRAPGRALRGAPLETMGKSERKGVGIGCVAEVEDPFPQSGVPIVLS
jgi:hypothetical protein